MKTWFITGASRGFGREWALAALGRGDQVVATARNPASLKDLVERFPHNTLAVRGHEKVPGYGQLMSPLVATRSPRFWPREVPTPH